MDPSGADAPSDLPDLAPIGAANEAARPTPASRPLPLSWGQRNSVAALLREVADALALLEHLLGAHLDTPLCFVAAPAPPAAAPSAAVLALANALAQQANRLAELVGVTLPAQPVGQTLAGHFAALWSDGEEIAPERLRDYGPVASEASHALRRPVAEMARLSLAISRVASTLHQSAAALPREPESPPY